MTDCPPPGIYPGVTFAEYREWDAMNASTLLWGLMDDGLTVNMLRLRRYLDGAFPDNDSDAKRFGRAFHTRLLEPDLFGKVHTVIGKCKAEFASGDRKGETCGVPGRFLSETGEPRCGRHKGPNGREVPEFVTEEELAQINRMREAAYRHPDVNATRDRGQGEACVVADLHGVRCKARLDKFIRTRETPWILDVKTIDATRLHYGGWSREVDARNYHVKAAFYIDAVKAVTNQEPVFYWVVCGKGEPYDAAPFAPDPTDISQGRGIYTELLSAYAAAEATGKWSGAFPASDGGPEVIGRPSYAVKKLKHLGL